MTPRIQSVTPLANALEFQEFYTLRSELPGFDPAYFEYLDYDHIVTFSQSEWNELRDLTANIDTICLQAYEIARKEFAQNLPEFLIFEDYFAQIFPLRSQFLARYDVIIDSTTHKYQFLETNANTPGLITESYHIADRLCPTGYTNISKYMIESVRDFYQRFRGKRLGILLAHNFVDEDYLMASDYREMLGDIFDEENIVIGDIFDARTTQS
jgi:glutathionylspermidine synthase